MKYLAVSTKEGIEDIVAEVKFERMRKSLDKDMYIDYVESEPMENDRPNRIFQ